MKIPQTHHLNSSQFDAFQTKLWGWVGSNKKKWYTNRFAGINHTSRQASRYKKNRTRPVQQSKAATRTKKKAKHNAKQARQDRQGTWHDVRTTQTNTQQAVVQWNTRQIFFTHVLFEGGGVKVWSTDPLTPKHGSELLVMGTQRHQNAPATCRRHGERASGCLIASIRLMDTTLHRTTKNKYGTTTQLPSNSPPVAVASLQNEHAKERETPRT